MVLTNGACFGAFIATAAELCPSFLSTHAHIPNVASSKFHQFNIYLQSVEEKTKRKENFIKVASRYRYFGVR